MDRRFTVARARVLVMTMSLLSFAVPRQASAQLGALVSPGRLTRAHASLEGITNCLKCHAAGEQVSATKCLVCHQPIAQRMARKKGVHRNVTTDCVTCHVEHNGADAELRPFDQRRFDHRTETGFVLDGLHASLSASCTSCHKTRSFLGLDGSCATCHADPHTGSLGKDCVTCHTTSIKFADTKSRFDHTRTAFPLTGAHMSLTCASCHRANTFKGVAFASCSACHQDPHRQAFGTACSSCHVTQTWRTTKIDHTRTAFALKGLHASVACTACHVMPAMQVKPQAELCSTCHRDPHQGAFKQDCKFCHSESGFQKGQFDHGSTRFPLTDKHAAVACIDCHKNVNVGAKVRAARSSADFRGLRTECASCHTDVHRGELGSMCAACHSARTFEVQAFTHAKPGPFFQGQHASLTCAKCHSSTLGPIAAPPGARPVRVGFVDTPERCVSCHRDVHLGQVGSACETCHSVQAAHFAITAFAHERTTFPLTGKHAAVTCISCHKSTTSDFPSGHGEARVFKGIGTACVACHQDPHRGEVPLECERCHSTTTFAVTKYTHINANALKSFFAGRHVTATCAACHTTNRTRSTAPAAAIMSFKQSTTCVNCHTDVHRGALGPRCETCHRP
jgi:hypothetical protein